MYYYHGAVAIKGVLRNLGFQKHFGPRGPGAGVGRSGVILKILWGPIPDGGFLKPPVGVLMLLLLLLLRYDCATTPLHDD